MKVINIPRTQTFLALGILGLVSYTVVAAVPDEVRRELLALLTLIVGFYFGKNVGETNLKRDQMLLDAKPKDTKDEREHDPSDIPVAGGAVIAGDEGGSDSACSKR